MVTVKEQIDALERVCDKRHDRIYKANLFNGMSAKDAEKSAAKDITVYLRGWLKKRESEDYRKPAEKQRLLHFGNALLQAYSAPQTPSRKNPARRAHVGKRIFVICRAHSGDMLRWCVPQQHTSYGTVTKRYNLSTALDIAKGVAFTDETAANEFMRLHFTGLPYRVVNTLLDVRRHLKMPPGKK